MERHHAAVDVSIRRQQIVEHKRLGRASLTKPSVGIKNEIMAIDPLRTQRFRLAKGNWLNRTGAGAAHPKHHERQQRPLVVYRLPAFRITAQIDGPKCLVQYRHIPY
jgi:hypothetical protein